MTANISIKATRSVAPNLPERVSTWALFEMDLPAVGTVKIEIQYEAGYESRVENLLGEAYREVMQDVEHVRRAR